MKELNSETALKYKSLASATEELNDWQFPFFVQYAELKKIAKAIEKAVINGEYETTYTAPSPRDWLNSELASAINFELAENGYNYIPIFKNDNFVGYTISWENTINDLFVAEEGKLIDIISDAIDNNLNEATYNLPEEILNIYHDNYRQYLGNKIIYDLEAVANTFVRNNVDNYPSTQVPVQYIKDNNDQMIIGFKINLSQYSVT